MYFQHDGAPPHYSRLVREYLNASFRNRWLGRGGPVAWPPRSPDLTPLDYYIWGHMKTLVYESKVDSRAVVIWKPDFKNTRYIRNNDPRSSYALHILNCRHEYGSIDDTVILLKQVNKPSLFLPYEQMFIQSLHHSNELINEQQASKHNPMYERRTGTPTSQTSKTPYQQPPHSQFSL